MALAKRNKNKARFVGIPHHLVASNAYTNLSWQGRSLLFDIAFQFNGKNNGDLTASVSLLGDRGWPKATLYRAFKELLDSGFVVVTRQGMKRRGHPTLIALTYNGIDEAPRNIRFDDGVKASPAPLNLWSMDKSKWPAPYNCRAP